MKPAILFPIETTARELLYKLFLSIKFAQKGYVVYLGTKEEIHGLFPVLRSFVYFDKGYHKGVSEKLYEGIKNRNGIIVNLDEEGGVDYDDFSTIAQRYSETLFKNAKMVFLWGSRQYEFLKSIRNNFNSERVVITGHPRFELLKPNFHALYQDEVESITNQYGHYILFNTNMGFGNNIRGDNFVRQNYGSRIKNIDDVIEYDKIKLAAYISMIKRLSPVVQKTIILRPHPEENNKPYIDAFSELANVKVLFKGSVIPWILGSDLMIHPDCTTGIEAALTGKLPVSYLPATNKNVITDMPLAVSLCINDENDCISYIVGGNYKNEVPSGSLLHEVFSHDKKSSDLIVDETDRLVNDSTIPLSAIINTVNTPFAVSRRLKQFIKKMIKRNSGSDPLIVKKRKGLDIYTISGLVLSIMRVVKFDKYPTVNKVCDDLFRIENRNGIWH